MISDSEENISSTTAWDALRSPESPEFKSTYLAYQKQVAAAVASGEATFADGAVFYRVAVIHLAQMVQSGYIPTDISLEKYLEALAMAHYHDWQAERKGAAVAEVAPGAASEAPLPDWAEFREIRHSIWARRQFFRLSKEYGYRIQELADDAALPLSERRFATETAAIEEGYGPALTAYKNLLQDYQVYWKDVLPAWVVKALTNPDFIAVWDRTQQLEQERTKAAEAPPKTSHFWRNAFVVMGIVTIIGIALQWWMRPKTPHEVYEDNFSAPKSLIADLAQRREQSPDKDSLGTRTMLCEDAFRAADEAYRQHDYRSAASELSIILDDTSTVCHSDAYFYLAIIGLHIDEPGLTIECLSNIEDLSRYGEDIYWYQALAFVKMATKNPMVHDKAVRAVERVISNTEIPERRQQAEKMLQQLNN